MTNIIKIDQEKQQIDHLRSLAKIASESKQYATLTESQLFNLMLSANDLGISPMKAINGGFYVVNGKVCMSTAMMVDRIRRCGHSIKVIELTRDKCVIIAQRKDNNDSIKMDYTWEDATLAGLINSPTWKKYPKIMLYNRCMSQIARMLFPDVVGNSYSEEERFDIQGVAPEERPLEDAEAEVSIVHPVVQEILTESQMAKLDYLLLELEDHDKKIEDFICKRRGISTVYDLQVDKFEGVVQYLESLLSKKRKEEANESAAIA